MIVANLGVLVGIIFLSVELQQNTKMMQAQTRDSIANKQLDWYLTIGTDPYSADVISRANPNAGGPLENEQERQTHLFIALASFRMWENEVYQYQMGLFDDAEFQPRLNQWKAVLRSNSATREIWDSSKQGFSPELRELIDGP